MIYSRQTWNDRSVEYPRRYTSVVDGSYTTFTPSPGTITEAGTPINASNLNNIETGIENAEIREIQMKRKLRMMGSVI